jgi:hypothetical protein
MRIPSPDRGFTADVMLVWVTMSISPQQQLHADAARNEPSLGLSMV